MALVVASLITTDTTAFASYCWLLVRNFNLFRHGSDLVADACYSCLKHYWYDFNDLYYASFASIAICLHLYPHLEGLEAAKETGQA